MDYALSIKTILKLTGLSDLNWFMLVGLVTSIKGLIIWRNTIDVFEYETCLHVAHFLVSALTFSLDVARRMVERCHDQHGEISGYFVSEENVVA